MNCPDGVDPRTWESAMDPDNRYFNVRVLEDGTVIANLRLMYTTALCVDLNPYGFEERYCYPDPNQAVAACNSLRSGDDKPLDGFIASRGRRAYTPANPTPHPTKDHGRS